MVELSEVLLSGDVDAEVLSAVSVSFESEIPGIITVADNEVSMITLVSTMPAGIYEVTISMITAYTSVNDKFEWRVAGSFTSPLFLKESKDAVEVIPFAYAFPTEWVGGEMTIEVLGTSLSDDVDVLDINILAKRLG